MVVVAIIGVLSSLAIPAFLKTRAANQDKAVLNNARQLASAADQYMLENGIGYAPYTGLVGPANYVKQFALVANETYPGDYTQGVAITVAGIAGARTVTYGL